jgi:succinate-semialdehyde dehydrogenase
MSAKEQNQQYQEEERIISEMIKKARAAQAEFEKYTQEQVDNVVRLTGKIISDNAQTLAEESVAETHFSKAEYKVGQNSRVLAYHWLYMKDKKSVGMIEDDPIARVKTYAKPMGVICCVAPSTNPTATVGANSMCAFKSRNAVIVAPHPGAKNCTKHAVDLIRGELKKIGAPEDLIQTVEEPSIEKTQILMATADATIATGGAGMVKSAYSSGRPSYGVGQGNVQIILDRDYTDLKHFVEVVIESRSYDCGASCSGEQFIHIPEEKEDEIVELFRNNGAFLVEDPEDLKKLKEQTFVNNGINRAIVGKSPQKVAEIMGFKTTVPDDAKVLMFKVDAAGQESDFCREIVCPMVRYRTYKDFEEGIQQSKTNLLREGAGHSCGVWSFTEEHINLAALELPVGRLLINQRTNNASGNTANNGFVPTMSLGCGSWGGNTTCDNLNYSNLMNKTRVAYNIEDAAPVDFDTVWNA